MTRRLLIAALAITASLILVACGSETVDVAKTDTTRPGAQLFAQRCGGCHTLSKAGTQGSTTDVRDRERTDGPNFDARKETVADVLYAIRNGGFSGAIMPENIATGKEALEIARFLAKYSGSQADQK
jgi:mono/diheme cytochrome c family protein